MANRLTTTLQENLLTLIGFNDKHGQAVLDLVDVEYFDGDYRIIAEKCAEYHERYKKAPGAEHIRDILSDVIDDRHNQRRGTYLNIIRQMQILAGSVNVKYVLDEAHKFVRKQQLVNAVMQSAELLSSKQEQSIEDVEDMWDKLLRAEKASSFDVGMKLTELDRMFDFLGSQYKEFDTGIPDLDKHDTVPYRGSAMLFLASTGMGKSWWLTHLNKRALMLRKKVLHISLEMGEEEVAARHIQSLFSVSKRNTDTKVIEISRNNLGKVSELAEASYAPELNFESNTIREDLAIHMAAMGTRFENLIIKRFPTRSLTVDGLRRYMDMLERVHGFIPDLLSVDYLGLFSTDVKDHRISLGRNFESLRGLAVERNMALSTAHQISRAGANAKHVDVTHVAEDWSLIGTADRAIVYASTKAERRLGLARLFVAKARSDMDKYGVLITQNYGIGQFVLDSIMLDDSYWKHLEHFEEPEDNEDEDDEEDYSDDD